MSQSNSSQENSQKQLTQDLKHLLIEKQREELLLRELKKTKIDTEK